MRPSLINLVLLAIPLTVAASDDGSEYPKREAKQPPRETTALVEVFLKAMTEQHWSMLPGLEVSVSANQKTTETDITIGEGEHYLLIPCPTDTWNSSPTRWKDVDYKGHVNEAQRTRGG